MLAVATRADVARFTQAGRDVVAVAQATLVDEWGRLDAADALAASRTAQDLMVDLSNTYGPVAAVVAADFYDDLRASTTRAAAFQAILADAAVAEQVTASARWSVTPLFAATPKVDATDQALANLAQSLQKIVMQPARLTVSQSVEKDPGKPRWARVPQGRTCAFCLVLASRGAVYRSAAKSGEDHDSYHTDCDCVPTPVWRGDALPEHYDPGALYEQYSNAREAAGSRDPSKILAQLRVHEGIA